MESRCADSGFGLDRTDAAPPRLEELAVVPRPLGAGGLPGRTRTRGAERKLQPSVQLPPVGASAAASWGARVADAEPQARGGVTREV